MLKMPIKILSDPDRNPFIPFVTCDGVFINGTDLTATDYFNDRYTKAEVDAMFKALGTVMDFRGVVENETQLPETAEPGDVYLVLHYEESTITHGVIWQDGEGWVDMGTPIDLSDYYVKEEVDSLVSTAITESEQEQREITNSDIDTSLANAKSYTDTKIYDLHIENYYTKEETKNEIYLSHTIPYRKGTPDEPLIIGELFENMTTGCNYYILMTGNVKATAEGEEVVIPYALYIITVLDKDTDSYKLTQYLEQGIQNIYILSSGGITNTSLIYLNENSDATITGNWSHSGKLKTSKYPEEADDVVNKAYLDEYVIAPLDRLLNRLEGRSV